jgi:nucleoside-diphosphate-sugar epimerase
MRLAIIGGTGHIGSFLTPRLYQAGHTVISISRGVQQPYHEHAAWKAIQRIEIDRITEEAAGNFGERIASLEPEVVIDLTCYHLESAQQLVASLQGRVQHLLHCGTIWIHGPSVEVPTTEDALRLPFGDYGIRKAAIEAYLLGVPGLPVTLLHPGHLVGPGWAPVNPAGNFDCEVFSRLLQGKPVQLPNIGMETLHHVHADDVAQCFQRAIERRSDSLGQSFHVVSAAALTLRGYAERVASWFGISAHLEFLPWQDWRKLVPERDATVTWDHIAHSPNCSITKARAQLGYQPGFSSLEAVRESLQWLIDRKIVRSA